MTPFRFAAVSTVSEASEMLRADAAGSRLIAGGTDLLSEIKEGIVQPQTVVSLQNVGGMSEIAGPTQPQQRIVALDVLRGVALLGDKVFVGTMDARMVALDKDTGAVIWDKDTVAEYDTNIPVWGTSSAPLVDGDRVIFLVGGEPDALVMAFDKHMPPEVPRVALVDTFKDETEEAMDVAKALRERLRGIRLDTPKERGGVTPDLVREIRARLDQGGYNHVEIFVSGGITPDRIRGFAEADAPVNVFAVGYYIASASPISFTADIKEIDGRNVAKRGRIPGLAVNPRLTRVL